MNWKYNLVDSNTFELAHKIYDSHDDLYDYDLEPKGRHYDQSSIQVGVIICLPIQSVHCFVYIYIRTNPLTLFISLTLCMYILHISMFQHI